MDRSRAIAVGAGVFTALLFAVVSTSEPARIADRAPSLPFSLPDADVNLPTTTTVVELQPRPSGVREGTSETAEWVTLVMELALMCMLLAAVGFLAKRLWQRRPAITTGRGSGLEPFVVLEEVAEAIADDAEAQRAVLRTGEPRNAIVECWLRVESLLERSGLDHDPAHTTEEFTARVFAHFDVDPAAVRDMSALYREARFSAHPMGEQHRAAAVTALDAIHASLRTREVRAP